MTQKNSDRTIEAIARIGIDLAKDIFHVAAMDSRDRLLLQKRFTRSALLEFLGLIKPCLAGMEACAGAHHLAGKMQQMGFDARLMAPQFVKPYVKSNKNDRNDAEAICEAVARPTMRLVPLKGAAQLELQQIHRIRSMTVVGGIASVDATRGFLLEFGITISQGRRVVMRELPALLGHDDIDLSASMGLRIRQLLEELARLESRILDLEREIVSWAQASADCKRLMTIPGVGPLGATVLSMKLGDAQAFRNGREFAAYRGLTPRQHSTGGKNRMLGISKRGDRYARTLLVLGAQSLLYRASDHDDPHYFRIQLFLSRMPRNKAACAIANHTARIAWALVHHEQDYSSLRETRAFQQSARRERNQVT